MPRGADGMRAEKFTLGQRRLIFLHAPGFLHAPASSVTVVAIKTESKNPDLPLHEKPAKQKISCRILHPGQCETVLLIKWGFFFVLFFCFVSFCFAGRNVPQDSWTWSQNILGFSARASAFPAFKYTHHETVRQEKEWRTRIVFHLPLLITVTVLRS